MYRQTKHQVPRTARPDAEKLDALYLLKHTTQLHATYQIRALTQRAQTERLRLVIGVPEHCYLHADLRQLIMEHQYIVTIARN